MMTYSVGKAVGWWVLLHIADGCAKGYTLDPDNSVAKTVSLFQVCVSPNGSALSDTEGSAKEVKFELHLKV